MEGESAEMSSLHLELSSLIDLDSTLTMNDRYCHLCCVAVRHKLCGDCKLKWLHVDSWWKSTHSVLSMYSAEWQPFNIELPVPYLAGCVGLWAGLFTSNPPCMV